MSLRPDRVAVLSQTVTLNHNQRLWMAASSKKPTRSPFNAPSQHNQSSRKGKKTWRKHVDIGEVEQGLEELRQEERVTGYTPSQYSSFFFLTNQF